MEIIKFFLKIKSHISHEVVMYLSPVIILNLLYFFHFLRFSMLFPLLPIFCNQLNFSPSLIGIVVSAHSFLSIFFAIPLGKLLDKCSPWLGVRIGFLLNFLYSLFLMVLPNLLGIMCSQLISGVGFLLIVVGSQAIISHMGEFQKKAEGFGKLALVAAFGQGLGPFLGGFIAEKYSFYLLFLITLIISIPGIVFIKHNDVLIKKHKNTFYIQFSFKISIKSFLKDLKTTLSNLRFLNSKLKLTGNQTPDRITNFST